MQLTRSARLVFPVALVLTLSTASFAAAAQDAAQVKKGEAVYTFTPIAIVPRRPGSI